MELGRQIAELIGIAASAALIGVFAFAEGDKVFAGMFAVACIVAGGAAVQRLRRYPE